MLDELEKLDESERVLRRARDLQAVAISMSYAPDRFGGVSLDGRPLPAGERLSIPDGARLDIEDVGRLDIHPGRRPDGETLAEAEAELARALEAAGASSIADARASIHRKRDAELRQRNAEADLKSLAPEGIDALRDRLATLPEGIADEDDLPTSEEAQQEDEAARQALGQASKNYEAARTAHGQAELAAAGLPRPPKAPVRARRERYRPFPGSTTRKPREPSAGMHFRAFAPSSRTPPGCVKLWRRQRPTWSLRQ